MRTLIIFLKFLFQKKKVDCPICNSKYPHFAPFNRKDRFAQCYKCGSLERHRLIWLYLNKKTNIFSGDQLKVLHMAPEKMFYDVFSKSKNISYFPCDLEPETFGMPVRREDITHLTFADNSFDVILCNDVLEHIPDDKKAMSELYRVLKPGGWAILQVPLDPSKPTYEDFSIVDPAERKKHFWQEDHVRVYGDDYPERLKAVGFKVRIEDFKNEINSDNDIYGIMNAEKIHYCLK